MVKYEWSIYFFKMKPWMALLLYFTLHLERPFIIFYLADEYTRGGGFLNTVPNALSGFNKQINSRQWHHLHVTSLNRHKTQ